MDELRKRTWAEVSLGAIEHNYRAMRAKLSPGTRYMGIVKADAYGHGAVRVSRLLEDVGCDYLAVACLDEAVKLRQAGIGLPVLILGYTPPEYAPVLAEERITQAVGSLAMARALSDALAGTGRKLTVHIKLETGMGRTGFRAYGQDALDDAAAAVALPGLVPEGIFTHFCVSDGNEGVRDFTRVQLERFKAGFEAVEARSGHRFAIHHCTNSGAMITFPETYMDMVRPGVALYGLYPGADRGGLDLIPAMRLYSRVACVERHEPGDTIGYGRTFTVERPSRIAVVPIGYADGLHRALSNKISLDFDGHRARQVGRICMDMCMADVTDLDVRPGDVAEVFGRHIGCGEVAALADTVHYELLCAVSPRVPRVYIQEV